MKKYADVIELKVELRDETTKQLEYVWFTEIDVSGETDLEENDELVKEIVSREMKDGFTVTTTRLTLERGASSVTNLFVIGFLAVVAKTVVQRLVNDLIDIAKEKWALRKGQQIDQKDLERKIQLDVLPKQLDSTGPFNLLNSKLEDDGSYTSIWEGKNSNQYSVDYDIDSNSYTICRRDLWTSD